MGAFSKFRIKSYSDLSFSVDHEEKFSSHGGVFLQFWLDSNCSYSVIFNF